MADVKDPVCGLSVDTHRAAGRSIYRGDVFYFCSQNCKDEFDSHPERYTRFLARVTTTPVPRSRNSF